MHTHSHQPFLDLCVVELKCALELSRLRGKKSALEALLPKAALLLADPIISESKSQKLTKKLTDIHTKIKIYQTRMLAFEEQTRMADS